MNKKPRNKYTPVNSMVRSTQSGHFTKNSMVKIELSLPVLCVTKIVTWKCIVGDSTTGRYDMIIGRDILTKLGIDLKYSTNNIDCGKGPHQGYTAPMENLNDYESEPIKRKMRLFLEE